MNADGTLNYSVHVSTGSRSAVLRKEAINQARLEVERKQQEAEEAKAEQGPKEAEVQLEAQQAVESLF
jgi:hypothetical protein